MRVKLLLPLVLGIATLGAASYGQSLLSAFRTPAQQKEAAAKGQLKVVNTRQKAIQDFQERPHVPIVAMWTPVPMLLTIPSSMV